MLPSEVIIVSTDENELTTEDTEMSGWNDKNRFCGSLWFSVHSVVECSLPYVIAK
ncbi:MAG TPA: hypothetical protein PK813_09355 [Candidatus Hydrogenedens sp.]|nr:hypothetical protein [Candidatus Hydrogenedens sp.]